MKSYYNKILVFPWVIILLLFSCSSENLTDDEIDKLYSPSALQTDVDYLLETLEKRHVNFYQRANKDSINFIKNRIKSDLTNEMDRKSFYKKIALLNPYFNDAHCLVFPLIDEANRAVSRGSKLFPFHVVLNEQGYLYPERSYQRVADQVLIEKTMRIEYINGIPAEEVIRTIEQYSHGETSRLRKHMTTLLFSDWLYTLYGWKDDFDLSLNEGKVSIVLKAVDEWKSMEINAVQYNRLERIGDVAYLRLNSFDVDEHLEAYEHFIDDAFATIKKDQIKKLIIDVRGNTGGQSDAGAYVLQYLTSKPLNQVSKAYERIHEGNAGWFNYKGEPGTLKTMNMDDEDIIEPITTDKRFNGEVLVLSDEMTYSAGIIFITNIQDHKMATLIGRPTGGYANQTGNIEAFRLPNTKLLVYAPARTFVRVNGDSTIHSVRPDIVLMQPDSLYKGKDYLFDYALEFVNEKK
jgi:Peptidase family S41